MRQWKIKIKYIAVKCKAAIGEAVEKVRAVR